MEGDSRIGGKVVVNNFSSFKLDDKEDIEAFEAEDIYGEEVTGKERLPVGSKETLPGTGRLEVA
jgi:hypothetical protein